MSRVLSSTIKYYQTQAVNKLILLKLKGDVFILKSIYKYLWEYVHKIPYGTDKLIEFNQIKVPWYYLNTTPRVEKVKKYYTYFSKRGFIDKPITVRQKSKHINILHNEYCRFLIMANEIDEYCKRYNITKYEDIPETLRMIPVKYQIY